ncbi:MAG: hypothetical protein KY453_07750 [Gemmatimonadetes bacterium]|nr:hypothetical protein [Gemmatimonadota bacterium]
MLRRPLCALALSLLVFTPAALSAQRAFGVGVRAGTLGIGGDLAVGLTDNLQVRGGVGLMPIDHDATWSDIDWTLELPSSFITAGLDFFPTGGGFRISGGMVYKPDEPELRGDFTGEVEVGGQTYTGAEVGTLTGFVESGDFAPFLTLGLGRMASTGIGLYVDGGVAFQKEPDLQLTATGPISGNAQFQQNLAEEERSVEEDIRALRFWPILNIGLRVGIGG